MGHSLKAVKTRIILVEDHDSVRRSLERALTAAGYSVWSFASAEDLLDLFYAGIEIDCLLVDIHLPGLSGLELYRELLERGLQFPAICMSSDHSDSLQTTAADYGVAAFLLKPFDIGLLLDALERVVPASRRA